MIRKLMTMVLTVAVLTANTVAPAEADESQKVIRQETVGILLEGNGAAGIQPKESDIAETLSEGGETAEETAAWILQGDTYMIPRTEEALQDFLERSISGREAATPEEPVQVCSVDTAGSTRLDITGSEFSATISRTSYPYYRKMICVPTVHVFYGQTELIESRDYTVNYSEIALDSGVGTYYVYIDGCNAYTGTIRKSYQITAQKLTSASLQTTRIPYDLNTKSEKKPAAAVKAVANPVDGDLISLLEGRDYTVQYKNNKIPGTAQAIVKGTGNYAGSVKLGFTITKIPLSDLKVKLSCTSCSYTGAAKKPTVSVYGKTAEGKIVTLKEGKQGDYTVSYKNNKRPGKAEVTVKAVKTGKYCTGSVTKTFTIGIVKTSLTALTAGSGSFRVEWKKKSSSKADGYQLQYAVSSSFQKAGSRIAAVGSTAAAVKGLKFGKTYYVRIRCYKKIGKTNYFSGWSAVSKVRTKK